MTAEKKDKKPSVDRPDAPTEDFATRIQRVINAFFQAILTGEFVLLLMERQWQSAAIVLVLFGIFLLPTILRHRFEVAIPAEFQLLVILFAFASLFMGSIRGLYETYWWWDVALHFSSGLLLGMFGFLIVFVMNENERVDIYLRPKFTALFAFIFAVAGGTLWEIFEFFIDGVFGYGMQRPMLNDPSGLTDTMWDLAVDSLGAAMIATLGWWYLALRERSFMEVIISKFVARNPNLFGRTEE